MATVDDKIEAATGGVSEAVAKDLNDLVVILGDITQAIAALHTLHPMAPAVLAGPLARVKAGLDDMRAKLNG